jgi:hypothetical protein
MRLPVQAIDSFQRSCLEDNDWIWSFMENKTSIDQSINWSSNLANPNVCPHPYTSLAQFHHKVTPFAYRDLPHVRQPPQLGGAAGRAGYMWYTSSRGRPDHVTRVVTLGRDGKTTAQTTVPIDQIRCMSRSPRPRRRVIEEDQKPRPYSFDCRGHVSPHISGLRHLDACKMRWRSNDRRTHLQAHQKGLGMASR